MTLQDASKIKIQVPDEDRPDSLFMDQIKYQRFEKLNHRVTILTILIPILIGVIIFIGYRDIREMVTQTQDMGAKELTSLAQSMDATVSNISIKQTKMDETLAAKVADQEKLEAAIQDSIKKMDTAVQDSIGKMENAVQDSLKKMETTVQDSIKKTETSLVEIQEGKANKKEIAGDISGVESKLTLIQKELKTSLEKMNADIKIIEKKVSDDLVKHAETINVVTTAVAECQADIALISSEKEDKKALEVALKNQEKRLQDQTSQLIRNLETKMESINASIVELGKIKSAVEKTALPPAAKKP